MSGAVSVVVAVQRKMKVLVHRQNERYIKSEAESARGRERERGWRSRKRETVTAERMVTYLSRSNFGAKRSVILCQTGFFVTHQTVTKFKTYCTRVHCNILIRGGVPKGE